MTYSATFDELQGWNYSVLANTYRVKSALAELSEHTRRHLEIVVSLKAIVRDLQKILTALHEPLLESLTIEQRLDLAQATLKANEGNANILRMLRKIDLGIFRFLYTGHLEALDRFNNELHLHTVCLRSEESAVLALSRVDQEYLVRNLLSPPEPSDRLKRALARHTVVDR